MKKILFTLSLSVVLALVSATSFAQHDEPETVTHSTPKWISNLGYWMVETNIKTPKHNTVYFYNNDNVMVYKETVDGIALKLDKCRTKMRLKKLVDQTVTAYALKQKAAENEMLVAGVIKK